MSAIVTTPAGKPAEALPLAESELPDESKLITEDGKPVDNIYSEKQMRLLTEPLYSNWRGPQGDAHFVAMANVALYFSDDEPLVPDVLLSVDVVPPEGMYTKQFKSYFVWRFGKTPEVVIEVVSNKEGEEDTRKRRIYARWGVPYYVIHDPDHHLSDTTLRIFELEKRRYRQSAETYLEAVGLGLTLWKGAFEGWENTWLRWCDRNGQPIPTGAEKAALESQLVVEANKQLAAERQRADSLLALLKEKGIDPSGL
jgi:Uma2 family endonuclease